MNLFNEPSWLKAGGLFSEPDIASLRESANRDAMMQMAMGLLAQSGYSTKPQTLGEGLASGVLAGQKAHRQAYRDALADKMTEAKLAQVQTSNQLKALRPFVTQQVETAPGQFGLNLKTGDPVAQQMARENLAMAEKPEQIDGVLKMLQESAAYSAKPGDDIAAYGPTYGQRINPQVLSKYKQLANPEQLDSLFKSLKSEQELMRDKPVGQPQAMMIGGAPVMMQRYESGALIPVTGATPYQAPTNLQQNYQAAVGQGFKGTLIDFSKATGSQGTNININNIPASNVPPTKKTLDELQSQVLSAGGQIRGLRRVAALWRPEFSTLKGKVISKGAGIYEFLGGELSPGMQKYVGDYSKWMSQSIAGLNKYINLITGAAIGSGDEEERIRAAWPDPQKDSPTAFRNKLEAAVADYQAILARAHFMMQKGLKPGTADFVKEIAKPEYSLGNMQSVIGRRADEIAAELKQFDPNFDFTSPEGKARVGNQLVLEFGFI